MSPLSFHYVRSIKTDLDLNGPELSFTTQPENQSKSPTGIATFVGIATATFPNPAENTGSLSYQWYEVGVGAVSNGSNITGAATTTLTISNLVSPTDNARKFFLTVDYVPSEDTGNAFNDNLSSNTATLSVKPLITINNQPAGITTVGTGADATITVDASLSDSSYGELSYQWKVSGTPLTDGANVVGSATSSLTVSVASTGVNTYTVDISAASADTVTSNSASLDVVEPRSIIKIEAYAVNNQYKTKTVNLDDATSFSIIDSTFGSDYSVIQFYAVEKDITLNVGMYGRKGTDVGSNTGGEGGFSNISLTLKKEVEHTVLGVSNNSAVFLYRGSNLIAVVGEGGNAGISGNGGRGGGINISGDNGSGASGAGQGGRTSSLNLKGTYGSLFENSSITLSPGDTIASSPNGGKTISCTKGSYWLNQGVSACGENSASKIRYVGVDGTTISGSSLIKRGFKPGYTISNTSGLGLNNGGKGGNGATGGSGGSAGAGGGGGSGFGDGTFNVLSSSSGGGVGKARISLAVDGGFYIDSEGRILILSTSDNRDPRTLTKTTGKVTFGSNTCIDDTRWRQFLTLARDGTQNYRITGTEASAPSIRITGATDFNIKKMLVDSRDLKLVDSLTGWVDTNYSYTLLALAWDETSGGTFQGTGLDYSILSWSPTTAYGYGFYGQSNDSYFNKTTYGYKSGINFWILPPGVPDF
jgi:hypothetical protein